MTYWHQLEAGALAGHGVASAPVTIANRDRDDRALVIRAQSGDTAGFDQLVNKYRDRVLKISLRYTRNWADAEDIAQATFLKAYLALRQFRGDSAFYSWLHRIAINTALGLSAKLSREPVASCEPPEAASASDSGIPIDIDTPEEIALSDELGRVVNKAIAELNCEQRTAIVLCELEGRSYSAVAREMSCPIGTVKSRVHRAREAIDIELRRVSASGLPRVQHAFLVGGSSRPYART